ncbi:MAG: O-antigen ligase family protein [Eubacteriales bacterium]
MDHTGVLKATARESRFLQFCMVCMAVLLNQSTIINNNNLAFTDAFSCLLLFYFILNLKLRLPFGYYLFFFALSCCVLLVPAFLDARLFLYMPQAGQVLTDYSKLAMLFVYFIVGYNIANAGGLGKIIKWFSIGAVCTGILGMAVMLMHLGFLSDVLTYAGVRLKGFMNDPNYFAVLEVCALSYFLQEKKLTTPFKVTSVSAVTLAVLAAGSKTGLIVLTAYLAFKVMEVLLTSWRKADRVVFLLLALGLAGAAAFLCVNLLSGVLQHLTETIPSLSRFGGMFGNLGSALNEGGSGRDMAWQHALQMISISPAAGVGIGVYPGIAMALFGDSTIAHNTYLQTAAEWGLVLAGIFFAYIFYAIGKVSTLKQYGEANIMARDILVIILLGSLGVSLNNARILWLLLGAISFCVRRESGVKIGLGVSRGF